MTWEEPSPAGSTWGELLDTFCMSQQSSHTGRAYRAAILAFWAFRPVLPSELTVRDVARWRDALKATKRASTVRARLAAVSTWCTWLTQQPGRLLDANPAAGVRSERVPMYGRARRIDKAEFDRIMAAIPDTRRGRRDRSLFMAYVWTLRRRIELLRLTWGDLEQRGGRWWYRYRGKRGKGRPRPMDDTVMAAVEAWAGPGPHDPAARVWPVCESAVSRSLKAYAQAAGVEVRRTHVHALRHLGTELRVRRMRRRGAVDLEEVQALLDHSSLAVTQVYLRALEDADADDTTTLSDLLED